MHSCVHARLQMALPWPLLPVRNAASAAAIDTAPCVWEPMLSVSAKACTHDGEETVLEQCGEEDDWTSVELQSCALQQRSGHRIRTVRIGPLYAGPGSWRHPGL